MEKTAKQLNLYPRFSVFIQWDGYLWNNDDKKNWTRVKIKPWELTFSLQGVLLSPRLLLWHNRLVGDKNKIHILRPLASLFKTDFTTWGKKEWITLRAEEKSIMHS